MRIVAIMVAFFLSATFCTTASAQATRTWVSGVGDDANPCSRTAPCKTFAGAISKTAAAGEINCLDPGGFGAVTITKALTIYCDEVSNGGVLVSGTNGIVVNVGANDFVTLHGLDINGVGPAGGSLAGVTMIGGGNLMIADCLIYNFQGSGGAPGVGDGVYVAGSNGAHVTIENSLIRDNINGVVVNPSAANANGVLIEHSVLDSNLTSNVEVLSAGAGIVLSNDSLVAAPTALIVAPGANVYSYGNNVIRPPQAANNPILPTQ